MRQEKNEVLRPKPSGFFEGQGVRTHAYDVRGIRRRRMHTHIAHVLRRPTGHQAWWRRRNRKVSSTGHIVSPTEADPENRGSFRFTCSYTIRNAIGPPNAANYAGHSPT